MMNRLIFRYAKVATKKEGFNTLEEGRVGGHHVYELAVLRTGLTHYDLAVLFNDLCFDLTRMFIHQGFERGLARDNSSSNFFHTGWTEAVSFARKPKRRGAAFI